MGDSLTRGGNKYGQKKWLSSKYPGVRFWEHPQRKHGVNPDKYFAIRYYVDGKRLEEGLGWTSQGWTAKKAADERGTLLKAQTTGEGARTLKERREIADRERAEIKYIEEQNKREKILFSSFFEETYYPISLTTKKPETYRKENELVKNWILPVVGNLPLKNISPFHLEIIKKNLLDAGRAPRTVQYCFAVFRHIWNTAKNHEIVVKDSPTKKTKIPSFSNERQRFLTHVEADFVLNAVREKSEPLYQMSMIALHCGLRASEIFHLTWGDVFIDDGYLVLKDTKGGKSGFAYLTDALKAMFNSMKQVNTKSGDLIFIAREGKKMKSVSNTFDRVVDALGLNEGISDRRQKIVFHSLRHTYASWLVQSGVDLFTVQKLMRHSNSKMTERYSHLGDNHLQAAVRRLQESMNEKQANEDLVPLSKKVL